MTSAQDLTAARRRRSRERLAARLAQDSSLAPHGSASAFRDWGCRCDVCRAWKTADNAAQYRRRADRRAPAGG